jgi:hypothetical protein
MPGSSPRRVSALIVVAIALAAAAVWLFFETRSAPTTATSASPPPAAPAADASAPRSATVPSTSPPSLPAAPAHAAEAVDAGSDRDAAHAERVTLVTRMASHNGREKWAPRAEALLDEIGQRAEHVQDRGCYISGCTATYTFASRASYDTGYRDAIGLAAYTGWTGGKLWTKPEQQDDGRIVVALLLYRID